jgi:hypothetical protein
MVPITLIHRLFLNHDRQYEIYIFVDQVETSHLKIMFNFQTQIFAYYHLH